MTGSETATRRWNVEVVLAGDTGAPLVLPVPLPGPREALDLVKGAMREVLTGSRLAGGFEYTVSVFPPGHRAGDLSVLAEKVTLVTCPPAGSGGQL